MSYYYVVQTSAVRLHKLMESSLKLLENDEKISKGCFGTVCPKPKWLWFCFNWNYRRSAYTALGDCWKNAILQYRECYFGRHDINLQSLLCPWLYFVASGVQNKWNFISILEGLFSHYSTVEEGCFEEPSDISFQSEVSYDLCLQTGIGPRRLSTVLVRVGKNENHMRSCTKLEKEIEDTRNGL